MRSHTGMRYTTCMAVLCTPRRMSYALIALLSLLLGYVLFDGYREGAMHWGHVLSTSGDWAWKLLALTIMLGLARKVFRTWKWVGRLVPLRKWTGVFALLFAVVHAVSAYLHADMPGLGTWLFSTTTPDTTQLLGWLGLLAMVPALVTGGTYMIRRLGGARWKYIQRVVHVAFIASALHIAYIPLFKGGEIEYDPLIPLVIYLCGYAYVFLRTRHTRNMARATVAGIFMCTVLLAPHALAQGTMDATGADPIFELLGQEKPEDWASWNRMQKFTYLQAMGVEPSGARYRGRAGDLAEYFEWLGVSEPEGWYDMSYEERATFIQQVQNAKDMPIPNVAPREDEVRVDNSVDTSSPSNTNHSPWVLYLSFLGAFALGILMMHVARYTD
jgi:DMSO/TMAO reductase YedYZ heme-binding membrane subunit